MNRRFATIVAAAGSTLLLVTTARSAGLGALPALSATVVLALFVLPFGVSATWGLSASLRLGERVALAALAGYPIASVVYLLATRSTVPGGFIAASATAAVAAAMRVRRGPRSSAEPGPAFAAEIPLLLLLVPATLWVAVHEGGAFRAAPNGGLAYEHSVDHSVHLALFWEMVRGLPPQQLPTAAGMGFPTYHTFGFMPGLALVKYAGLNLSTAYHVVLPLFRSLMLAAAAYLAALLRTRDRRVAVAAVPALLLVSPWLETVLADRMVLGPSPYYFFLRNEAGGAAVLLWAAVGCLLLLHPERGALPLAGLLTGLGFGFKAQMFVLFGGAFSLLLVLLGVRSGIWPEASARPNARPEPRRSAAIAGALAAAAAALSFALARGHGPLGTLHLTPGLFAELYVYPSLTTDPWGWVRALGETLRASSVGWWVATPLAVWRLTTFAPVVPPAVASAVRRFRAASPADLMFALVLLVAVPLGYVFSAVSIDREVSPFEFLQAAHGLAFWAAVGNVIGLAAVASRRGRDGGRLTLAAALLLSAVALPALLLRPAYVPPREAVVLSADEACALAYLRYETPFDAVTVGWRESADGVTKAKRLNHQAVLGGFAGRRSLLEYYGHPVDPRSNREKAIRQLFTTTDPSAGLEILDRYAVDYVVEFPGRPLLFTSPRLTAVYASPTVRVLGRADAAPASRPAPPAPPWAEPSDLACRSRETR